MFQRGSVARGSGDLESRISLQQHEILVRLLPRRIASICEKPDGTRKTLRFQTPVSALNSTTTRGQRRNRTVRAVIPRLVWQSGSRGSITPVNVSQAVPTNVVRESVRRFSQRQMPGILPGGGLSGARG